MVTDLSEIRRRTQQQGRENLAFRRFLRKHHYSDETFRILAQDVSEQMDCTACANCCRQTIVSVTIEEIARIAEYLQMEVEQVRKLYSTEDPDVPGGRVLVNEPNGCVFLDGNLCTIYDVRPKPCRDFPHISRQRTLAGRMASITRRAWMCPIVYNALEEYKHAVGFQPKRDANGNSNRSCVSKYP